MSKGKKILKIFGYGVISQVITLLLGIIIPKLMIVSYGSEVNGLLSSIRQVFVYVALLEAGIGTASLQALYAPIATNDKKRTCEIMSATNRYYKRTGILYGIAVIALAIIYPIVVKSDIPVFVVVAVIFFREHQVLLTIFFKVNLQFYCA